MLDLDRIREIYGDYPRCARPIDVPFIGTGRPIREVYACTLPEGHDGRCSCYRPTATGTQATILALVAEVERLRELMQAGV